MHSFRTPYVASTQTLTVFTVFLSKTFRMDEALYLGSSTIRHLAPTAVNFLMIPLDHNARKLLHFLVHFSSDIIQKAPPNETFRARTKAHKCHGLHQHAMGIVDSFECNRCRIVHIRDLSVTIRIGNLYTCGTFFVPIMQLIDGRDCHDSLQRAFARVAAGLSPLGSHTKAYWTVRDAFHFRNDGEYPWRRIQIAQSLPGNLHGSRNVDAAGQCEAFSYGILRRRRRRRAREQTSHDDCAVDCRIFAFRRWRILPV